jgi:Bacillus/Clostridium GerA spore germination protein
VTSIKKQIHRKVKVKKRLSQAIPLSNKLEDNINYFSSLYMDSNDVIFRSFTIGDTEAVIIHIEGLSDLQKLDELVLENLMNQDSEMKDVFESLKNNIPISKLKKVHTYKACIDSISIGNPIILIDGQIDAYVLGIEKYETRQIEEPSAETGIRGLREGFTESININTALIRRIIKDPALKMKSVNIGKYTKTRVIILY